MILVRSLALLAVLFLSACTTGPQQSSGSGGVSTLFQNKAEKALANGIGLYEDGKYPEAILGLQDALNQGLTTDNQVKAHKYLAFTYCVSGKDRLCREEFKKALELNPAMELAPSEAGHPIWGPVFKSVKAKKLDAKK
jgi:Tfp pilus assembly protein PilF